MTRRIEDDMKFSWLYNTVVSKLLQRNFYNFLHVEFFFKLLSSQGRLGMHRYAVDTFLILCYPNEFPAYSCFTKTMRGGAGRQCYHDNKLKMFLNASCYLVSACKILLSLS